MYVLNFGMVGDQILVKKKDPPYVLNFGMVGEQILVKKNTLCRNSRPPLASRE